MTLKAIAPLPSHIIDFAAWTLPSSHRHRYRRELTAELHVMPREEQLRYAVQVLSRTWALRAALNAPATAPIGDTIMSEGNARPLHCRLHLWHHWQTCHAEDGHRYKACAQCGKEIAHSGWGFQVDA